RGRRLSRYWHASSLATVGGFFGRGDGAAHDEVRPEPAELGARAARVTLDAADGAGRRLGEQRAHPHQPRVEGERERGIGQRGVVAELLGPVAARLQDVTKSRRGRSI